MFNDSKHKNRPRFSEKRYPLSRLRGCGDSVPNSCRSRCRPDNLWGYRVGINHAYGESNENASRPRKAGATPITIPPNKARIQSEDSKCWVVRPLESLCLAKEDQTSSGSLLPSFAGEMGGAYTSCSPVAWASPTGRLSER